MRRTVQGLFARRLLSTTAITTAAVVVKMNNSARQAGLYGAMAYLMGGEYVCTDCRKHLAEDKRRRKGLAVKRPKARALHTQAGGLRQEGATKAGSRVEVTSQLEPPMAGLRKRRLEDVLPDRIVQPKNAIHHWTDLIDSDMPTFLRLQHEIDVENRPRLVDYAKFGYEPGLWRLLLNFSQRVDPEAGVRKIWNGMRRREIDIPTQGEHADALWRVYVSAALGNDEFTDLLIEYAEDLSIRSYGTKQWPHLYDMVMYYHLVHSPQEVVEGYHRWLYPRFQAVSWQELFRRATIANQAGASLKHLHRLLPQPAGLYDTIIQTICTHSKNRFRDGLHWHHYLLKQGDLPPGSSSADHLIRLTARYGNFDDIKTLLTSISTSGIPFEESSAIAVISGRMDLTEAIDILLQTVSSPQEVFGDNFWSQIFCTQLKPATIATLIHSFGRGCTVGDSTLAQVSRLYELPPRAAMAHLRHLGLTVTLRDPRNLPDSPASLALQAALLQPYLSNQQLRFLLRKLLPPRPPTPDHNPKLLAHHLQAALHHLNTIRATHTPLDYKTLLLLPRALLQRRQRGGNPSCARALFKPGADLDFVTSLHLQLCYEGFDIPQSTWRELFIRFGKAGRLADLERLFVRLLRLYRVDNVNARSRGNPLRLLFDQAVIRACVEWGFICGEKEFGFRVVRGLQRAGVWVDERSVKKATRNQVAGLEEAVVRVVRKECEVAWGGKLWDDDEPVEEVRGRGEPDEPGDLLEEKEEREFEMDWKADFGKRKEKEEA